MNPLLVSGFGTTISVDRRRLIIYNRLKNESLEFYPHQIDHDSIIVDGHTGTITFDAIRWLMKHDIKLTILNWNGNLLGVTLPKEPKNGKLKVMQYQTYLDSKKRFAIASEIVSQKIGHTQNLLRELALYYAEVDFAAAKQFFINEKRKLDEINAKRANPTMNDLMLYEGRIATYYWDVLVKIFNRLCPEFHFVKRGSKSYSWNMNASDEVNALLNYGYAILESEIRKGINAVGLDPTVGFLHELAQSKEPLVYDIQELLRWLIDLSVLQLLEQKTLKKSDFILTENYHLRLKPVTAKLLIEKLSLNFNATADYKARKHTYQNILYDNIHQLGNFIAGKRGDLRYTIPPMKIQRSDPIDLRQRILGMSSSERKRRRINKSTLWYQKRNLMTGRKVAFYRTTAYKMST